LKTGAIAVLLILFTGGCGTADSTPPNTTPPPEETSATTEGDVIEQFVFIRFIEGTMITFDPAEILTGEEAREAAVEAGVIEEGEDLPNDFFVDNPDQTTTSAGLSPDGEYVLLGFDRYGTIQEEAVGLHILVAVVTGGSDQYYGIVPGEVPANLTLAGDTVTVIKQVYFP
jgi:hypothetical protein